ncbi:MAG: MGMT family protein [Clostridia bacterium]|nr:MGMT family protein [Clostridia bacterium]
MRNLENELKNKIIDDSKLIKYGFVKQDNCYLFHTKICNNQFEMIVSFSEGQNTAKLIDIANEEEYIPVDIQDSVGEFVGKVREEYENKLQNIIEKCTIPNVFKSSQAKEVIQYVTERYGDDLEFLWEKFDNNAIWRNKANHKWYGALLTITEDKLGINSNKTIEILDLRYQKDKIHEIIDNKEIYPGYHMNKSSWITIKLDNTVSTEKILKLLGNSYELSIGNKCGMAGDELSQKVYDYLTTIPQGKVVTYGQIAQHLGNKGLARVVGSILHKNPDGDKYPCYKVLNGKGELAEAFVFGGKDIQKELLEKEGIKVINAKVDLAIYQWKEK